LATVFNGFLSIVLLGVFSIAETMYSTVSLASSSKPGQCNAYVVLGSYLQEEGRNSMKDRGFVRENTGSNRNMFGLLIFVAALFFLLLIRLWYLQIVKVESYMDMSENNRLRLVPVPASRGTIFDRNGKILASNRPSFSVAAIPREIEDKTAFIDRLAQLLGVDRSELSEKWDRGRRRASYFPIVLASALTRDQLEVLEENRLSLPGLDVQTYPVRDYPNGVLASHLLGYLGHMSERQLASEPYSKYNPGAYVGKSGIERTGKRIHGSDGRRRQSMPWESDEITSEGVDGC
jgi:penicillin-binding protein 2